MTEKSQFLAVFNLFLIGGGVACWYYGMPPYQLIGFSVIWVVLVGIIDLLFTIKDRGDAIHTRLGRLIEMAKEKTEDEGEMA
jgi:hypothetical protein